MSFAVSTQSIKTAAKVISVNAALIFLFLAAAELFLRHQDMVELDYTNSAISELIHHNRPGHDEAHVDWHFYGRCAETSEKFTILFLGDSWVEGGEIIKSVGENLIKAGALSKVCIELLNTGVTSYSPLLYTLKAKSVAKDRRIDMVIVNIDETDLMDDWLRYRPAVVRDELGNLTRVPFSRDLVHAMNHQAYVNMTRHKIYLFRLIEKADYIGIKRPAYEHRARVSRPTYENILGPQLSIAPEKSHVEPIAYFRKTVDEMVRALIRIVSDKQRVVITFHPHYLGLFSVKDSERYNDIVPNIIREISDNTGVDFYDATGDATKSYAGQPGQYFKWPSDPFSHLTPQGYAVYGRLIAQRLAERISNNLDG